MLPYRLRARVERLTFIIVISSIVTYAGIFFLSITRFVA
tara:strand:- start:11937 stop:12053 length:117 start_codon:yes stop_codon:yes gene_type:complete